tara:strand:+ start:215 stop:412 length:198 start_codon:yes stop_codon:yes gene_type:complete
LEKGLKNFFKKRFKKYCGIRKRVLYLHPLREETIWEDKKHIHFSFPLGEMSDRTDGEKKFINILN